MKRDHLVNQMFIQDIEKEIALLIITNDPRAGVRTRRATLNECLHAYFLSQNEPKKIEEVLLDPNWIVAMQKELNQFERNNVLE